MPQDVTKNKKRQEYFIELEKEINELIDPITSMLSESYSKKINCPICSGNKHETMFTKKGYTFVRCNECEHIYTNPQVNEDCLNELYGKSKANDLWAEVTMSEAEREWKHDYYQEHLNLLLSLSKTSDPQLLDLGCATGQFLEIAREKLSICKGLEISEVAYRHCVDQLKLDVEKATLEESSLRDKQFDIISMFGVLEHLPRPLEILGECKKNLNSDGLLIAIVPNAYSLYHTVLGSESVTFDGRNHLNYFTPKTAKKIFERAGYEIVHLDTVLDGFHKILSKSQIKASDTNKFLDERQKDFFKYENIQKICKDYNLGLRVRIIGKKIK